MHRRYGNDRAYPTPSERCLCRRCTLPSQQLSVVESDRHRREWERLEEGARKSCEGPVASQVSHTVVEHAPRGPIENRPRSIKSLLVPFIESSPSAHRTIFDAFRDEKLAARYSRGCSRACACGEGGARRVLAHVFPGSGRRGICESEARREERLQLLSRKRSRRMVRPRGGRNGAASGGQQADR